MTTPTATANSFDFGRIVKNTFGAIQQNAATFIILALVLAGIPAVISTFGMVGLFSRLSTLGGSAAPPPLASLGFSAALSGIGVFLNLFTNAILQASIIYGTAAYLNGRTASLGECLGAGLRWFLPLIGLIILMAIALFFGFIFFFVPGVLMAIAWIVAVPVLVVERTGVFAAFSRSADLTRGRRWAIFGFLFLYFIAFSVVQQVALNIVNAMSGAVNATAMVANQLPIGAAFGLITSVVASAGVAAIYYELRTTREGVGPEAFASVFD